VSETGHVDDDTAHQLFARNLPKPGIRHEHSNDVRAANRLHGVAERDVGHRRQLFRWRAQIRIGNQDLLISSARELAGDLDCGALPQVVDIRLVGQSQAGDDRPLEPFGTFADLRDYEFGLGVVDLACRADQPSSFRRRGDNEPWIDGDAVPATPAPGCNIPTRG